MSLNAKRLKEIRHDERFGGVGALCWQKRLEDRRERTTRYRKAMGKIYNPTIKYERKQLMRGVLVTYKNKTIRGPNAILKSRGLK